MLFHTAPFRLPSPDSYKSSGFDCVKSFFASFFALIFNAYAIIYYYGVKNVKKP